MSGLAHARRVLVTGAAGFVGANVARRLLSDGHDVHVLVGPSSDNWRLDDIMDDITVWNASLQDRDAVVDLISRSRPERVFHLAAHGAYSSQRSVERMVETNIVGTVNLVEACLRHDVATIVNTGSSSEYGYKDHAPSEREWVDPNSHYAVTKAAATMYCRYTSIASEIPITTLRLYSVYGPWEEPTRLMPRLAALGLEGKLPPLVSPSIARDYVHVDDVVQACLLASDADRTVLGGVYNVGTGVQTSLADLVEIARKTLNITSEPIWGSMADRDWDTDVWVCDSTSITADLGWSPEWNLTDGFAKFSAWLAEDDVRLTSIYRAARPQPA
ncbi:Nucleoside-diphosphate-sugar epimerase [Frankineae bacterium MT45]|nr:Nucleoside-diphosphate-sugar epimerase [Frankineae bacterium MT45]